MDLSFGGLAALSGGSTALSYYGQHRENEQNRSFIRSMSSTAHQREVADLRAAGLNPILSATGGRGASSPASSGGSMPGVPDFASTALQTKRLAKELEVMESQVERNIAESGKQTQDMKTSEAVEKGQEIQNVLIGSLIPSAKAMEEFDKTPEGEKLRYLRRIIDALKGTQFPGMK